MRSKAGMKFDCILEEPLDFIEIDYTHLNKTIRYEQRPHGEWITKKDSLQTYCSHCDTAIPYSDEYDFSDFILCPYCGADMRKEGEANG